MHLWTAVVLFVVMATGWLGCASGDPAASSRAAQATAAASAEAAPGSRHVLLTLELSSTSGMKVLDEREVAQPLPDRKVTDKLPWRFEVFGPQGERLHQASLNAATELRGEFADESGKLSGVRFVAENAAFAVRVPSDARSTTVKLFAKRSSLSTEVPGGQEPDEFIEVATLPYPREVAP